MYQYDTGPNGQDIAAGLAAYLGCTFVLVIIMIALQIWLFYRILKKAGMNPWLSLLVLLWGFGTFILLFILALGEWPALRGVAVPSPYQPGYTPPVPAPVQVPPAAPQAPVPPAPPAAPEEPPAPGSSGEPPAPTP